MKGTSARQRANIFSDGVCLVCDGAAKDGANIMNVDGTCVRVCDRCFERLWKELYQEPAAVVSCSEARVMEEYGQC